MKEIQLSGKGEHIALVDDEDFEALNKFTWRAQKQKNIFYAIRIFAVNGKKFRVRMHCAIMNRKGIDHIDHDGLNNQKNNLRFCTNSENSMNRRKRVNCTSIYKGVYFSKAAGKWQAYIMINGKHIHLGLFASEADAAKAYNTKAVSLFREFANLNIIC